MLPWYRKDVNVQFKSWSLAVLQSFNPCLQKKWRKWWKKITLNLRKTWPVYPTPHIHHIFCLISGRTEQGRGSVCLSPKLNRSQNILALLIVIFWVCFSYRKQTLCLEMPTCIFYFKKIVIQIKRNPFSEYSSCDFWNCWQIAFEKIIHNLHCA